MLGCVDYRINYVVYNFACTHARVTFVHVPTGDIVELDYIGKAVPMVIEQRSREDRLYVG